MKVLASIYSLAAIVATLVLVTTCLPQPTAGTVNDVSLADLNVDSDSDSQPPKTCLWQPGSRSQHDLMGLKKRDSQPSGMSAPTLEPRMYGLPCGRLWAGGQSTAFQFLSFEPIHLLWTMSIRPGRHFVRIMMVVENGADKVVARALARKAMILAFTPRPDAKYYVQVTGSTTLALLWWFRPLTAASYEFRKNQV
ncbi:hypothetical protein MMC07_000503 [Pseudocyphellaria aurata]|nr:hypothetical protein [Pseudocyphellaria aurata]